jgi:Predicted nucleoside-diphosphate-sugar epimerases
MILAVTGITGHTGGFFLQELIKNKFDGTLRVLVRESSDTRALDASGLDVEKVIGDIKNSDDLFRLVNGADRVLHIAGIRDTLPLLAACERADVTGHIVLVHTTGIYSKFRMASGEYKEIEEKMRRYLGQGMNITIIRPTMIFGDMCDRNIHKFIRMVDFFPVMPQVRGGRAKIRPVNARDLGRAYYQCVMKDKLPELDYVCSGSRELSLRELCSLIGIYLGKKTHFVNVPVMAVAGAAWCVKQVSRGKIDYVEKALRLSEDRVFDHEKATRDFGFEPEPFEFGLRREVEEYLHGKK